MTLAYVFLAALSDWRITTPAPDGHPGKKASGQAQIVKRILIDDDQDCLLIEVESDIDDCSQAACFMTPAELG